jgi:hypothetical protein
MVRKLLGLIRHWKEQSEFRMVLHYYKNYYAERVRISGKNENIAFFLIGHLGQYLCCFYRTFTFFISKTDKIDSFQ